MMRPTDQGGASGKNNSPNENTRNRPPRMFWPVVSQRRFTSRQQRSESQKRKRETDGRTGVHFTHRLTSMHAVTATAKHLLLMGLPKSVSDHLRIELVPINSQRRAYPKTTGTITAPSCIHASSKPRARRRRWGNLLFPGGAGRYGAVGGCGCARFTCGGNGEFG